MDLPEHKALHPTQQKYLDLEAKYGAFNYLPVPVVLSKGEGVHVWDTDGRRYYDFLSAYSAVNQGHSHPKIVKAFMDQVQKLALTSRAFHNDILGPYEEFMTKTFGFDRLLPMNTGVEGVETAIKLARRWGYDRKGIAKDQAKVVVMSGNFHGRTLGAISLSTDPSAYGGYGPLLPGIVTVPYNNYEELQKVIESDQNICAVLLEPIQGEAGVLVPSPGYLSKVSQLLKKHNVLFIADEVQTGLARTGKMLCVEHDNVKPDILILGKALSGGLYPVSAVLSSHDIMLTIQPGQHGSTYGGNPLACAIARAAVEVLIEENLAENSERMGALTRQLLGEIRSDLITTIRGKGLLNAVVIKDKGPKKDAYAVCLEMAKRGVLAKPTRGDTIRLAPPLCITEAQVRECIGILQESVQAIEKS